MLAPERRGGGAETMLSTNRVAIESRKKKTFIELLKKLGATARGTMHLKDSMGRFL